MCLQAFGIDGYRLLRRMIGHIRLVYIRKRAGRFVCVRHHCIWLSSHFIAEQSARLGDPPSFALDLTKVGSFISDSGRAKTANLGRVST